MNYSIIYTEMARHWMRWQEKKKKKMPHEIMAGDFGEEGENSDRKYNFRCIKVTKKELN